LKPVRKRKLVDQVRGEWGVSIRRACRVFLVDTSTYHYKSRRAGQAGIEQRIKEICQTRAQESNRRAGSRPFEI
jgi:putative transposase